MELWQIGVSCVLAIMAIANTWLVVAFTSYRAEIGKLREADADMTRELSQIRELVAGRYLTREEFSQRLQEQSTLLLGRMDALSTQIASRTP